VETATDWKIQITELEPEFGPPEKNDTISLTVRQMQQTWTVLRPTDNGLVADWIDHSRSWARVHTKLTQLVNTAAQPAGSALNSESV